jgi:hypothetical protein
MNDLKETVETLEKLNKALEAGSYTTGTAIKVEDHTDIAKKYLSAAAIAVMATKKAKSLIVMNKDGTGSKCIYFAVTIASSKLDKGVEKIASIANDLVSKGLVQHVLAPVSSLSLAKVPGQVQMSAVFFFPLVPMDKADEIAKSYEFSVQEGECGKLLEPTELPLERGEFWAEARITHSISNIKYAAEASASARLYKVVREYLKHLPEGTEFLKAEPCAIMDLSIPYELHFFNPRLARVKKVDLEHVRHCEMVDGKLEQFNLFLGIRYFDSEGKLLFHGKE